MSYSNFYHYGHHFKSTKDSDGNYGEIYVMPEKEWDRYMNPEYSVKQLTKDIGFWTAIVGGAALIGYALICTLSMTKWGIDNGKNPLGLDNPLHK